MSEVNGLNPCIPEKDLTAQYFRCNDELKELGEAIQTYIIDETGKNRAEIAFEAMDVITSVTTLLNMLFSHAEIKAAVRYTNAKNYVRGYCSDGD